MQVGGLKNKKMALFRLILYNLLNFYIKKFSKDCYSKAMYFLILSIPSKESSCITSRRKVL